MGEGRGSAGLMLAGLVVMFVIQVEGATYTVGDSLGWGFQIGSSGWTNGKSFKAGDILVFKYSVGAHNVVVVSSSNYGTCSAGSSLPLTSGNDKVSLNKGDNYFICSFTGHCDGGMKLHATAA